MAKKKGLAAYKRAKKNSDIVKKSAKSNPPAAKDLVEFVVPGFVGYAGTRMASRIVHGMVIKRFPKLAKHASVISTGVAAAAAWLLVHRIEKIQQYHTPVVVGASIAAIQTTVQAYLPKYGWMVSDHNLNAQTPQQAAQPALATVAKVGSRASKRKGGGAALPAAPSAPPPPIETLSADELADELDDLDMGVLASSFDLDGLGGISDYEMDSLIDEATTH